MPFDTLVIFSTNFHPNEIFDGAALRRIFFKIKIDGPDERNFLRILAMVARAKKMTAGRGGARSSDAREVPDDRQPLRQLHAEVPHRANDRGCASSRASPYQMTPDLIDRAWGNMFVREEVIAH